MGYLYIYFLYTKYHVKYYLVCNTEHKKMRTLNDINWFALSLSLWS